MHIVKFDFGAIGLRRVQYVKQMRGRVPGQRPSAHAALSEFHPSAVEQIVGVDREPPREC